MGKLRLFIEIIGALSTIAMSIASFISAAKSYSLLKGIHGDYEIYIRHWESQPLIDIQIVGSDDSCPLDYELGEVSNATNVLQTIGQFPGSNPWCDCADDGFYRHFNYTQHWCWCGESGRTYNDGSEDRTYYTTDYGSGDCSNNNQHCWTVRGERREGGAPGSLEYESITKCASYAEAAGCTSHSRPAIATEIWTTREGYCDPNATFAGCRDDHPLSSVDLTVWKKHKLCYKRGGWSALERIEALNMKDASCSKGVVCQQAQSTQDPSNTICAPTAEYCPLVYIGDLSFLATTNASHPELTKSKSMEPNYLPIVEIRTTIGNPCWKGSFGQHGRLNNERVANKYDTDCMVDDTRFVEWDSYDEPSLYNENRVPTGGHKLMGNDAYSDVQYYNESDVDWKLFYRREIFWSSDCESGDISDLAKHLKPLRNLVDYHASLNIVNGVFGLGASMILTIVLLCMHCISCCDEEDEGSEKCTLILKAMLFVSIIAKMIPLILCVAVTGDIHWFFTTAGKAYCSDDLTNQAMSNLGSKVNEVKKSNLITLYLDIGTICWYIPYILPLAVPLVVCCCFPCFRVWYCIFRPPPKSESEPSADVNDTPLREPSEERNDTQLIEPSRDVNGTQLSQPYISREVNDTQLPQPSTEGQPIVQMEGKPEHQPMPQSVPQPPLYVPSPQAPVYVQPVPLPHVQPQQPQHLYVGQSSAEPGMMPQPQSQPQYVYQHPQTVPSVAVQNAAAPTLQVAWQPHQVINNMNQKQPDPMSQYYY